MRDFKDWRADIERRAAEVKETLSPERVKADLEMLQGRLVGIMEQTEELVDWFDTAGQHEAAYFIIDGMIEFRLKHMSGLDPASPDFDIETTTYPQPVVDLLLEWDRITIEHLKEMRQEVGQ